MNGEEEKIITVFVAASSAIARAGLEAILADDADIIVTDGAAEIPSAPSAFSGSSSFEILLAVVENQNEFAALSEFIGGSEDNLNTPLVVALVAPEFQNQVQVIHLLQNGVRGILPNDAGVGEIIAAIGAAANNLLCASPQMLETLFDSLEAESLLTNESSILLDELIENLTAREQEVLELLSEGASNKSIAYRLDISEHTVKFHVASIFGKLGVNTRTEAVTQALRRGLILL